MLCICLPLLLCDLLKDKNCALLISVSPACCPIPVIEFSTNVREIGEDILEVVLAIRTLGDRVGDSSFEV